MGLPHGPNPLLFALLSALCTMLLAAPAALAREVLYRRPPGGLRQRGDSFIYRVTPFRMFFLPLSYAAIPLLGFDYLAVEMLAPKLPKASRPRFQSAPEHLASLSSAQLLSEPAVVQLQITLLVLATLTSMVVAWRITGAEVTPVTHSPTAARIGAAGMMALGGVLVITCYLLTQGEAG
jgi:hypothetical protein